MSETLNEQRLITVAIHTYDRAVELKHRLEHQGIQVVLHNVNLSAPVISSGIRVRIREIDLPAALRIIENNDIFGASTAQTAIDAPLIILPIDFVEHSLKVCKFAFNYAASVKADLLLLNSYINPALSKRVQLTDNLSFELSESQEVDKRLYNEAQERLNCFSDKLFEAIKSGELPPVKFTAEIQEGVPEDVIVDSAKRHSPLLIIMGTRGAQRKEEDLIGSVTAEVLDSSRFPVLSLPETINYSSPSEISRISYFANLDQDDIIGIEILHKLFYNQSIDVILIPSPGKREKDFASSGQLNNLALYCRSHYPNFKFSVSPISLGASEDTYRKYIIENHINLIAVPNKKRNVFSRFFNPSVAHRMLLRTDAPMIVVPV